MSRGIGLVDAFQQVVPEALAFPVALLTQLGALWFALGIIVFVYRYHDRQDAVVVVGVLLAGTALWRTIKIVWPVPRPDEPFVDGESFPWLFQEFFEMAVVDAGPGFPSGHAVTTTILYFSLAEYLPISTRRRRYTIALFLIALVGATRITLGVHYLVDVIAGAMFGHLLLMLSRRTMRTAPAYRASIALGFAVVFSLVSLTANLVFNPVNPRSIILAAGAIVVCMWWHTSIHATSPLAFDRPNIVKR